MTLTKYISFRWESHDIILTSVYPYPRVQVESRRRAAYLRSTATAGITPHSGHKSITFDELELELEKMFIRQSKYKQETMW